MGTCLSAAALLYLLSAFRFILACQPNAVHHRPPHHCKFFPKKLCLRRFPLTKSSLANRLPSSKIPSSNGTAKAFLNTKPVWKRFLLRSKPFQVPLNLPSIIAGRRPIRTIRKPFKQRSKLSNSQKKSSPPTGMPSLSNPLRQNFTKSRISLVNT
jgi:hypothetical protein